MQDVELLDAGQGVQRIASAIAHAAESELESAKGDPSLAYSVWLLTQIPLVAGSDQFVPALGALGFEGGDEQSALTFIAGISKTIDQQTAELPGRTDLGELVRQAISESITAVIASSTPPHFETAAIDLKRELAAWRRKIASPASARHFNQDIVTLFRNIDGFCSAHNLSIVF